MTSANQTRQGRTRIMAVWLAIAIAAFDQLVKWIVTVPLSLERKGSIRVIEIFDLTWAENRGISLSMFTADSDAERWLLVAVTAAVTLAVAVWMWKERARGDVLALAMILGGAIGNIIDRARLGYVVDYADLHFGDFRPFLIFNVADACITIGVLILVARALLLREKTAEAERGAHDAGANDQQGV